MASWAYSSLVTRPVYEASRRYSTWSIITTRTLPFVHSRDEWIVACYLSVDMLSSYGIPSRSFMGICAHKDDSTSKTEVNSLVYQLFKQSLIFMFSIAYVFTVTLVSAYPIAVTAL